jgi:hypothetical protein
MTNGWWELHPFGEETFYAFEDIVSWEEIWRLNILYHHPQLIVL